MHVCRPVDHDLLPLERRVEIRHDATCQPVGPSPSSRASGGVSSSCPAQNGHASGESPVAADAPGRPARAGATDPAPGHQVVSHVCHAAIQQVSAPM